MLEQWIAVATEIVTRSFSAGITPRSFDFLGVIPGVPLCLCSSGRDQSYAARQKSTACSRVFTFRDAAILVWMI